MLGIGRWIKKQIRNAKHKNVDDKPETYALFELDLQLLDYVSHDGGYFIELGANDGITQSNTYLLEKNFGWNGLLIEAIPHKYFECKKQRSPDNQYFFAAVVNNDYQEKFVELRYCNLMTVPATSLLDAQKHADQGTKWLEFGEETITFGAPARTLSSILDEVGAPKRIDLFSLDVEGGEKAVLEGTDFSKYSFKFILVESFNIVEIKDTLEKNGYVFIKKLSQHDYLFKKSKF